jgi:hypothetical protein
LEVHTLLLDSSVILARVRKSSYRQFCHPFLGAVAMSGVIEMECRVNKMSVVAAASAVIAVVPHLLDSSSLLMVLHVFPNREKGGVV